MSQAPSPEMARAMRVAEWRAEAALSGRTLAQVATEAMVGRVVKTARFNPHEGWAGLSEQVRGFLVAIATDKPTTKRVRWDNLTPDEQMAVGVMARLLVRELAPVAQALR